MVEGVLRRIDEDGKRGPDVVVPTRQLNETCSTSPLTGMAGNPFPVYFFIIAPSGPFDVP